jgi:AcrR family transcriptional regulator
MSERAAFQPRKTPKQRRSRETVDAILDATARVLVEEGYERATTNHIAAVAGVSVGSLYQYFPSKEALVAALVERHAEHMLAMLGQMAADLMDVPLAQAVRLYVRAVLTHHAEEPELHRVLVSHAAHLGLGAWGALEARARKLVVAYLAERRREILPRDLELAAFVLVSAVEAVTHRAVLERDRDPRAFEEEICALVLRYLVGDAPPAKGRVR